MLAALAAAGPFLFRAHKTFPSDVATAAASEPSGGGPRRRDRKQCRIRVSAHMPTDNGRVCSVPLRTRGLPTRSQMREGLPDTGHSHRDQVTLGVKRA
jgi:hypothetical protein